MDVFIRVVESGLLFVAVIALLVIVHEFGHFVVAKLSGMRVDEFGIGFPPRALVLGKIGETEYTLNWLPIGGFVRIHGEDGGESDPRAFTSRPRILQALVLIAGVTMNFLLAYVLIVGGLMVGTPRGLAPDEVAKAHDLQLYVSNVLPGSPAAEAGLTASDIIRSAEDGHYQFTGSDPAAFASFVAESKGNATLALDVQHPDGTEKTIFVRPVAGLISSDPSRPALGVEVSTIGILPLSFTDAVTEGALITQDLTVKVWNALGHLFMHPSLSQIQGPIGIAADTLPILAVGFGYLLTFVSSISVMLAIVNLVPIPALDGGRLLVVIIEGVSRRRINPAILQPITTVSFALLLLLMVVVSVHDVFRIFS